MSKIEDGRRMMEEKASDNENQVIIQLAQRARREGSTDFVRGGGDASPSNGEDRLNEHS
jgi:hypothetical protein